MPWPFKTLKRTSTWPLQPLAIQFAAAVLTCPEEERPAAAHKMVERCLRLAARLAVEFGIEMEPFVQLAAEQIAREQGAAEVSPNLFGAGEAPQA